MLFICGPKNVRYFLSQSWVGPQMYLQPTFLLVLLKAVYYLALYIDDNKKQN